MPGDDATRLAVLYNCVLWNTCVEQSCFFVEIASPNIASACLDENNNHIRVEWMVSTYSNNYNKSGDFSFKFVALYYLYTLITNFPNLFSSGLSPHCAIQSLDTL